MHKLALAATFVFALGLVACNNQAEETPAAVDTTALAPEAPASDTCTHDTARVATDTVPAATTP